MKYIGAWAPGAGVEGQAGGAEQKGRDREEEQGEARRPGEHSPRVCVESWKRAVCKHFFIYVYIYMCPGLNNQKTDNIICDKKAFTKHSSYFPTVLIWSGVLIYPVVEISLKVLSPKTIAQINID